MLINERTAIRTSKVILLPYCRHHVTTYHDWMQDPDIQAATASEPLCIQDEYSMQASWRSDPDKLTFILCTTLSNNGEFHTRVEEIASMIGDVNLFVSVQEDECGKLALVGELELMVAVKDFQHKGFGRSALLTFLYYITRHEEDIVQQFPDRTLISPDVTKFDYFTVKIGETNVRSMSLFEGAGFKKVSDTPSFFGEYELRHHTLSEDAIGTLLSKYSVQGYKEVKYGYEGNEE